ncbi:CHAT domain-containing protein [Mycena leptocephala]|nr:CHAT domain-containing protein [Mycena leptocephala]
MRLSTQLEWATTRKNGLDSETQQSLQSTAHEAHQNAHKRDLLLKKIRQLEGFQQFLLPKTISELSTASERGPVVIVNASLRKSSIPCAGPDTIAWTIVPFMGRGDIDRLHGQREGGSAGLEEDFAHILSELWLRLVKPVLEALAITTPTKNNLPRIWWCPTGLLTLLPIHAAGLYGKAALIQGLRPTSQPAQELQLLAVAQPSADGQSHIPGTKDEIKRIEESRVEEGMMKSAFVHFACHGVQDVNTPTESALLLAGSSKLTLERIIQLSLPHADLAFLSACQTATGDKKFQEESVHLAAGMLLAGYRGVIATMWSILDNDAPQVAEDVYKHLFKTSPIDPTRAAEALYFAVRNLRERSDSEGKKKSFFDWVPFIHVGV